MQNWILQQVQLTKYEELNRFSQLFRWHLTNQDELIWHFALKYFNFQDEMTFSTTASTILHIAIERARRELTKPITLKYDDDLFAYFSSETFRALCYNSAPVFDESRGPLPFIQYVIQERPSFYALNVFAADFGTLGRWIQDRATMNSRFVQNALKRYTPTSADVSVILHDHHYKDILNPPPKEAQNITDQDKLYLDVRRTLLGYVFKLWLSKTNGKENVLIDNLLDPRYDFGLGALLASQPSNETSMFMYAALIIWYCTYVHKELREQMVQNMNLLSDNQMNLMQLSELLSYWEPNTEFWAQFVLSFLPSNLKDQRNLHHAQIDKEGVKGDQWSLLVDVIEYQMVFVLEEQKWNPQSLSWEEDIRYRLQIIRGEIVSWISDQVKEWCAHEARELMSSTCDRLVAQTKLLLTRTNLATPFYRMQAFLDWWDQYDEFIMNAGGAEGAKDFNTARSRRRSLLRPSAKFYNPDACLWFLRRRGICPNRLKWVNINRNTILQGQSNAENLVQFTLNNKSTLISNIL